MKHASVLSGALIVVAACLSGCHAASEADNVAQALADRLTDALDFDGGTVVQGTPPAGSVSADAPQISKVEGVDLHLGEPFSFGLESGFETPQSVTKAIVQVKGSTKYIEVSGVLSSNLFTMAGDLIADQELVGRHFELLFALQTLGGVTGDYKGLALVVLDQVLVDGDQDLCDGVTCNSHGTCLPADGSCQCNAGYAGTACGSCASGYDGYPNCQPVVNLCDGVTCNSHGVCLPADGSCQCTTGYAGDACDACDIGYDGYPNCQPLVDLCDGVTCNSHGACLPADGSCQCTTGYAGDACDACDDGYENYPDCTPVATGGFPPGFCLTSLCFALPPTGQSLCYTWGAPWESVACPGGIPGVCGETPPLEGCGQDAQYSDPDRSFNAYDSGSDSDGITGNDWLVEDSRTGLMWQRDLPTAYPGCTGTGQYEGLCPWSEAIAYCDNLGYGGFDDWRLPNPHEMLSIFDDGRAAPAIDDTVFPLTPASWFWTSSLYQDNQSLSWSLSFDSGNLYYNSQSLASYARCVRLGAQETGTEPYERYAILGESDEQWVEDRITGLSWQLGQTSGLNWLAALAHCEELQYAGHDDWRLPNKVEIMSIVNFTQRIPATDFPPPGEHSLERFWSSTSKHDDPSIAYYVWFRLGQLMPESKAGVLYARCVRGSL